MAKTQETDLTQELYNFIKKTDLSKPGNKPKLLKKIKSTMTRVKKKQTNQNKEMAKKPLSPLQKAYRKYFQDMLVKYKAESPAQIKPEEKKKEFFNNIKKYWINGEGAKDGWDEKVTIMEGRRRTKLRNYSPVRVSGKIQIEKSVINENKLRAYINSSIRNYI